MNPILSKLLYDNESLFEYERNLSFSYSISFERIKARLIAMERLENKMKNDAFYENLGDMYLDKYRNLPELLYKMPRDVAKDILCFRDGFVFVKKEKFEKWMELISFIPPTLFIAAFLMDRFTLSMLSRPAELCTFIKTHLSQFVHTAQPLVYIPELNFLISENEGLNDLHIHLNGSTETDAIWHYMIHNPYRTLKDFMYVYNNNSMVRKHTEQTIANFTPVILLERLKRAYSLRSLILMRVASNTELKDFTSGPEPMDLDFGMENLAGSIFNNDNNITPILDEILFYIITLCELEKREENCLAAWLHHYLLIKGIAHRLTVMQKSQTGFPQFQLITENSFRFGVESFYAKRFMQLAGGGPISYLNLIEGRFSPPDNSFKLHILLSRIKKGFEEAKKESAYLNNSKLILVAHFIKKREHTHDKKMPVRHRLLRHELKKKALALVLYMKKDFAAAKLIRGIDAAASEFDAGPDVFAHTFRFLRKNGIDKCTFHVGEDFRHILSGIRNIYEAIMFLELQTGDRLGHCTALGICPELWVNRTGSTCIVSQGEWLDNLVFIWYIIKETKCKELQGYIIRLENDIAELSHKVYNSSYPPYILAEAWKMRKYNPFLYLESEFSYTTDNWYNIESPEEEISIRKKLNDMKEIKDIWMIYHRMYGNKENSYDKLIEIENCNLLNYNEIRILQNLVLNIMALKGIVIETLPTSNVRISYYKNLGEYHLSRWICNNTENVLIPPVVLGTDDPGIFSTNIYNEFAKAYLHLEASQSLSITSVSDRILKISGIHNNSRIYNFIQHE